MFNVKRGEWQFQLSTGLFFLKINDEVVNPVNYRIK